MTSLAAVVVGATIIAVAVTTNQGSGTYPDAAAAAMKAAGANSLDVAAAYCGVKASDLTHIDGPQNSDIPAEDWLPGTGPEDLSYYYGFNLNYDSPGSEKLVFSDTVGGAGSDIPPTRVIVKCPSGSVGTVPPS